MMAYDCYDDRRQLLKDIGIVDFAVVDMGLYLDTHPYDKEALSKWKQYQRAKRQLMREYTIKFGPLVMDDAADENEWKWALQDWPWERGYH